jgi:hypothetical protein
MRRAGLKVGHAMRTILKGTETVSGKGMLILSDTAPQIEAEKNTAVKLRMRRRFPSKGHGAPRCVLGSMSSVAARLKL